MSMSGLTSCEYGIGEYLSARIASSFASAVSLHQASAIHNLCAAVGMSLSAAIADEARVSSPAPVRLKGRSA